MIPFMVNSINAILVWHLSNIDMNLTHRQLTMFRAIMLHGNPGGVRLTRARQASPL
jgi:hypothetical protein